MRKYGLALLAAAVLLLAAATAACVKGGSGGGSSDPSSGEIPAPESSTDGKTDAKRPDTSDIFSETESETYVTTPETTTVPGTTTVPDTTEPPETEPPVQKDPIIENGGKLPSDPNRYTGKYSGINGALAGTDALGRKIALKDSGVRDRKVGVFYFLWQGEHGTGGPYDNNKIVAANRDALLSESNWQNMGGGARGEHHFWGEPLFGYYRSSDTWVMRKHLQMLTDAGVDFLVFDATNAYTYSDRVKELISVWYEYLKDGVNVPKLAFYTNTSSGDTMRRIYDEIYNNAALKKQYPRLDELWFNWNGKPMIVGISKEADSTVKSYFTIKESTWPNAGRTDNGFPWMEFGRSLTAEAIYGVNGRKEVINVSLAQHSATCRFSATAWYGANDRTRSWHNGKNDTSANAMLYGYNFAEQFDFAIKNDPEMIFITGFNEWVAQRQPGEGDKSIVFVDCADPNNSRDFEPMKGGFGDNYFLQAAERIAEYKGTAYRVNPGKYLKIDVNGSFSQWDSKEITAVYTDYRGDTVSRNHAGFGSIQYRDASGKNDFRTMKVARGNEYIYFYAQTGLSIKSVTEENRMALFIGTGDGAFSGFDYVINCKRSGSTTKATVERLSADGSRKVVGTVDMKTENNRIMFAVPRALIGCDRGLVDITFKWADGFTIDGSGKIDIMSFYTSGDAAPIGRFAYVFSEKK